MHWSIGLDILGHVRIETFHGSNDVICLLWTWSPELEP